MRWAEADVAVVGLGSIGSLTLWQLARRGVRAIGLDQFQPGHDRGEAHGESRIIRSCYTEGPLYVPLLQLAFPLWRELERETGAHLLNANGALFIGWPDSGYLTQVRSTADSYGLPYEILPAHEARRRYPQHRLDPHQVAFLDLEAGLLHPELAVRAATARAADLGARVVTDARVEAIEEHDDGIDIRTTSGTCRAGASHRGGGRLDREAPTAAQPAHVDRAPGNGLVSRQPARGFPSGALSRLHPRPRWGPELVRIS